jgi:hypothetical protein
MRKGFTRKPQPDAPATPVKNYITPSGLERLKDEHRFLLTRERKAVVEVVAWAAGNGDRRGLAQPYSNTKQDAPPVASHGWATANPPLACLAGPDLPSQIGRKKPATAAADYLSPARPQTSFAPVTPAAPSTYRQPTHTSMSTKTRTKCSTGTLFLVFQLEH